MFAARSGVNHPDEYAALKALGHSASKAAEIVLDARSGDLFSRRWIAMALAVTPEQPGETDAERLSRRTRAGHQ